MPAGTSMALVPVGVVPKRPARTYSPGWMSVSASSELLLSVTLVRAPAGRPFEATEVFVIAPVRIASFSIVPDDTALVATYTSAGC